MGIPFGFGRLAVKEQSGGWGTAETSFANANYVEAQITSPPSPMQDSEQMPVLRGDVYAPTRVAGGRAPTEIQITMPLHGFSTASPAANPTEHPDALLLRSVLGAAEQAGYHGTTSDLEGGTTSVINIDDGTALDAEVGHALLIPLSSGHSVGWVKTGDTTGDPDTYTLQRVLSAAPASSGVIYGGNCVYSAVTQPTAFTLEWLGSTDNVKFRFEDCVVTSATITLETLKQPTLAVTISALDWSNVGTGGAPGAEALTDRPQMPVCISANGFRAVTSAAEQKIVRATINMSATVAVDIDSSSSQGRGRFTVTDRSVTAEVTAQALSSGASTLNDPTALVAPAAAAGAMQIDANTTPGRAFSVLIPAGVATATSTFGSDEDMLTITTAVECGLYTGDTSTGAVSAPANTSFRLAFL